MPDDRRGDLPLVLLPQPVEVQRAKRSGGGSKFQVPSPQRQAKRLAPQFDRLQQAFEAKRAELRGELAGVEPELALVFETIGTVQDFLVAVRKIPGMEWLAEVDEEEIAPDGDFQATDKPDKLLSRSLYLIMSDRRAVEELLSLWQRWQQKPEAVFLASASSKRRDSGAVRTSASPCSAGDHWRKKRAMSIGSHCLQA